jgi:hypothetical protein
MHIILWIQTVRMRTIWHKFYGFAGCALPMWCIVFLCSNFVNWFVLANELSVYRWWPMCQAGPGSLLERTRSFLAYRQFSWAVVGPIALDFTHCSQYNEIAPIPNLRGDRIADPASEFARIAQAWNRRYYEIARTFMVWFRIRRGRNRVLNTARAAECKQNRGIARESRLHFKTLTLSVAFGFGANAVVCFPPKWSNPWHHKNAMANRTSWNSKLVEHSLPSPSRDTAKTLSPTYEQMPTMDRNRLPT